MSENNWKIQTAREVAAVIQLLLDKYPNDIRLHCEHDVLVVAGEIDTLTPEDKAFLESRGVRYESSIGVWQMYVSC